MRLQPDLRCEVLECRNSIRKRQLGGDLGTPETVAYAALYLAPDESLFVMGSDLIVDGGTTGGKQKFAMQRVSFTDGSTSRAGVRLGEVVYDADCPMTEHLDGWPRSLDELARRPADVRERSRLLAAGELALTAPVPAPSKMIGVGINYIDNCREHGVEPLTSPSLFAKFPTWVIGPGEAASWPDGLTDQVDWDVELAVVIGRRARRVARNEAADYIAGYTVANGVSGRDLQFGDGQCVRGKSIDGFCPLGAGLVRPDEVGDPEQLRIRLELNGATMPKLEHREPDLRRLPADRILQPELYAAAG